MQKRGERLAGAVSAMSLRLNPRLAQRIALQLGPARRRVLQREGLEPSTPAL